MSSEGRRPRWVVKIGGQQTKVLAAEVVNNSHFQCDTFRATLTAWQQPNGFGIEYWDGAGSTEVEILLGFLQDGDDENADPSDLTSLIIGEVDDVDIQADTGVISLSGRDYTARLIDNKVAQTWPDHTASQIVTDLAGQVGLTPKVTATKTPVGKYGKDSYTALRRDVPMWDLVTYLAENEGFDAYVTGKTLYFGPPTAESKVGSPIQVSRDPTTGAVNVSSETLKLHRSLTLAKDIVVTVMSYNSAKKQPIKAVAKRQGSAKAASTSFKTGPTSQNYVIRRAGLTQQQAQDLAQKTLDDLSKHERTLAYTDPCDAGTTSRSTVSVSGTNTGFDTSYFIDVVTRTYQFGSMTMTVTGKNHQVESQPDSG